MNKLTRFAKDLMARATPSLWNPT